MGRDMSGWVISRRLVFGLGGRLMIKESWSGAMLRGASCRRRRSSAVAVSKGRALIAEGIPEVFGLGYLNGQTLDSSTGMRWVGIKGGRFVPALLMISPYISSRRAGGCFISSILR